MLNDNESVSKIFQGECFTQSFPQCLAKIFSGITLTLTCHADVFQDNQ